MIDKELLDILACPETKEDLQLADSALIDKINAKIAAGNLTNRSGQKVTEKIDGGLIQKNSRRYLYPIKDSIPILLIDESISMSEE